MSKLKKRIKALEADNAHAWAHIAELEDQLEVFVDQLNDLEEFVGELDDALDSQPSETPIQDAMRDNVADARVFATEQLKPIQENLAKYAQDVFKLYGDFFKQPKINDEG